MKELNNTDNQRKNHRIYVLVTSTEKAEISSNAHMEGMGLSSFVRKRCLEISPVVVLQQETNDLLLRLSKLILRDKGIKENFPQREVLR